jgi:SAM-dependent methyltransferase
MIESTIAEFDKWAPAWAEAVRGGRNIAHRYLEKPQLHAKLPDLSGKSVLCVACGSGEECAHLKSLGASRVVGIDLSAGLLAAARQTFPEIEYYQMDMERIDFEENTFDLAYSSLALHYVPNWSAPLNSVYRCLKPGGTFLFSTHHPLWWCAQRTSGTEGQSHLAGYSTASGQLAIFGDYFERRLLSTELYPELKVRFYYKPLAEIFSEIREAKFVIDDFVEPKPLEEYQDVDPGAYQVFRKFPIYMIFALRKPFAPTLAAAGAHGTGTVVCRCAQRRAAATQA